MTTPAPSTNAQSPSVTLRPSCRCSEAGRPCRTQGHVRQSDSLTTTHSISIHIPGAAAVTPLVTQGEPDILLGQNVQGAAVGRCPVLGKKKGLLSRALRSPLPMPDCALPQLAECLRLFISYQGWVSHPPPYSPPCPHHTLPKLPNQISPCTRARLAWRPAADGNEARLRISHRLSDAWDCWWGQGGAEARSRHWAVPIRVLKAAWVVGFQNQVSRTLASARPSQYLTASTQGFEKW
jgi:hypothetical protein